MTTRTHTQTFDSASVVNGPQEPINLESLLVSATTLAVLLGDGSSATYSVEYTMDDVNAADVLGIPVVPVVWFTSEEFPDGSAASKYASFHYPIQFARINIETLVGDLQFKALQSFNSV
jgi:hypothetical protein